MAVTSGFFNSVNHDRLYNAEQFSSVFDGIINDGVYQGVGEAFSVTAYTGSKNTVVVGTGRAWFDHTWTLNDSPITFKLEEFSSFSRIDAIVLDIDRRESVRKNSIILITGNFSPKPSPPALIKSDLHNQYPIAYITTPIGADANLTNGNISNRVGTEDCPLVTGIIEAVNAEMFYRQLEAKFNTWWDGVKDTVGNGGGTDYGDLIEKLEDRIDSISSGVISKDDINKGKNITISSLMDTFGGTGVTNLVDSFILPDGKNLLVYIHEDNSSQTVRMYAKIFNASGATFGETDIATISTLDRNVNISDIPDIPGLDKDSVFTSSYTKENVKYGGATIVSIDTDAYPVNVRIGMYFEYSYYENLAEGYTKLYIGTDTKTYNITVSSSAVITSQEVGGYFSSKYNQAVNTYNNEMYDSYGTYILGHTYAREAIGAYIAYFKNATYIWISILNSLGVLTKTNRNVLYDVASSAGTRHNKFDIVAYSDPDQTGIYVADNKGRILYIYNMQGDYQSFVRNDFSSHPHYISDFCTEGATDVYFKNGDKFQNTTLSMILDGESFDYPVFFDRFVYPNDQATPSGSPSTSIVVTPDKKYGFVKYGSNSMVAFVDPGRAYGIYSRVCSANISNLISENSFTALKTRKLNCAKTSDGTGYIITVPGSYSANSSSNNVGPISGGGTTQSADIAIYKLSIT